jgi:hypothetical protein
MGVAGELNQGGSDESKGGRRGQTRGQVPPAQQPPPRTPIRAQPLHHLHERLARLRHAARGLADGVHEGAQVAGERVALLHAVLGGR